MFFTLPYQGSVPVNFCLRGSALYKTIFESGSTFEANKDKHLICCNGEGSSWNQNCGCTIQSDMFPLHHNNIVQLSVNLSWALTWPSVFLCVPQRTQVPVFSSKVPKKMQRRPLCTSEILIFRRRYTRRHSTGVVLRYNFDLILVQLWNSTEHVNLIGLSF